MESAQNSVWHRVSAMYLSYHYQTSNNHYYSFILSSVNMNRMMVQPVSKLVT